MRNTVIRKAPRTLGAALALSLGLTLSACSGGSLAEANRSLDSVHQPVVERTNYALDLTSGPGGLSLPEQRRLAGWFEAMDLRYGDRISVDDPLKSSATRAAVQTVADQFGMLVGSEAPVTSGALSAGTVRVVVTRSSASVKGCPDWSTRSDTNFANTTSAGYGCAVNGNLAAMVADPEHLVKGAKGSSETVIMSSNKAIESYRDQKPTGERGLKQDSTQTGK